MHFRNLILVVVMGKNESETQTFGFEDDRHSGSAAVDLVDKLFEDEAESLGLKFSNPELGLEGSG